MSEWYYLIYQDGPEGPKSVFSRHRKRSAAEKARAKNLKNYYWRLYDWTIEESHPKEVAK